MPSAPGPRDQARLFTLGTGEPTMIGAALSAQTLLLLGCGRKGSALLAGWLKTGMDPQAIFVMDPHPSA